MLQLPIACKVSTVWGAYTLKEYYMQKKFYIVGLLLLLVSVSIGASTTLTLDEALQLANSNNLNLASTSIDVASAKRDIDTSWNLFLPTISASISTSGNIPVFQAPTISSYTYDSSTGTILPATVEVPAASQGLSVGLSASFQLNPAVKDQLTAYNIGYRIQQVTYKQAQAEVEKTVKQLFYFLLMQKKNIDVQQANLELAKKQYDDTQKKYDAGFASEIDLLSARLSYEQLKPTLQQAQNQYQSSMLSFKAMLGEDLSTGLVLEGTIPTLINNIEVQNLNEYLDKTYGVMLLDLNKAQLQANQELSKKQAYFPTLSMSGSYGISLWSDSYTNDFSDGFSYQVAVAIPLDGFIHNSRTDVSMQKLDDSIAKLSLQRQQAVDQLEVQVVGQVQSLNMLFLQADLANQSLDLTQQLYDMQSTQYENGYVTLSDLEEAQNNLLSAKQNILALQYQYITALVDLTSTLNIDMKELY